MLNPSFPTPPGPSSPQNNVQSADCMECRMIGVVTLSGISLYMNHLRMMTSVSNRTNRIFLASMSVGK